MSNRTIKAPGVEIFEHDMSEYPAISEGTHVLLAGFAQKGEDYTPYRLTSRSSWLKFYGAPTNEAEEYFYTAANEVLDKGGYLYSVKIPYSNDIRGIYAAAKYKIEPCRDLLSRNESGDFFLNLDGSDNMDIENGSDEARLMDQYKGLKKLGINSLSKIAPQGQDFLSYDLVEEYEAGESKPNSDVIYIVDKTRAVYTRATKVSDVQPNRDARACLGIVPVITTLANTAWFQKQSTGLTSPINELYQPVRSLKTITFPAGAASAAEYQPTYLKARSDAKRKNEFADEKDKVANKVLEDYYDLAIELIKENGSYDRSLSEMAAMQAQSCLLNGNMVEGHFAPDVCNDVAVIVFKAFISTEDGKIDFEVVEQFVGSLDPDARDEKGVSKYIGTLINNTSDYIYFFANLNQPKTVLKMDHAFVAGSNSSFGEVEDSIKDEPEYKAAQAFGGYTARMLGFDNNEVEGNAKRRYHSLKSFYNQDAKQKCAVTDEIIMGGSFPYDTVTADCGEEVVEKKTGEKVKVDDPVETVIHGPVMERFFSNTRVTIKDTFITEKPKCIYKIGYDKDADYWWMGALDFKIDSPQSKMFDVNDVKEFGRIAWDDNTKKGNYTVDDYESTFKVGRLTKEAAEKLSRAVKAGKAVRDADVEEDPFDDVYQNSYELDERLSGNDLYQLSIFNSTDYLRAILKFNDLVDEETIEAVWPGKDLKNENDFVTIQDNMIRMLVVNSIEKTARYKVYLRRLKKAAAAVDRLDDAMATFVNGTTKDQLGPYTARVYVRDLYNSLNSMGVLSGIDLVKQVTPVDSSVAAVIAKSEALEKHIEDLVNPDTTKKEKADPKVKKPVVKKDDDGDEIEKILKNLDDYPEWYIKCRVYLKHKLFECYKDMYEYLCNTFDDCAYTADRYLQTCQSVDDSTIMLGFYPEMAEPIITYTEIAQSINKMYDTFGDLNSTTVDVVLDAGLSNIAQFVKQVYDPSSDDGEDIGGRYEPVRESAYYKFNKNTDLSYWKTIVFKFDTFCKSIRKDCMFVTECPRHLVLNGNKPVVRKSKKDTSVDVNIIPYLTKITGFNTSYGAGYMNWYKTVSDYTGDILWVPPSIVAAGTYIVTDRDYNWWDAPAGMKRGKVSMADTSFNPNMRQAGEIYDVAWNYAINYQGEYINGIIQEGQKTFQSYHSAFDRVNVRRLFLRCERYVYFASRAFLYEPNTAYTRRRYVDTITPFFEDIKNRGGMYAYKIICDDSNNTPDTIDRNELRVKIGIQPVKTIEFILVDFVASRTGSDWSELATI